MSPMKRLVVALVFLLFAVVIFILVSKVDMSTIGGGDETAIPTLAVSLFSASSTGEVTRIQVKDNTTGDIFAAEKKEGIWVILEAPEDSDTGLGIDQERTTNALVMVPAIQPSRTLSGIEALATYGLGDAAQYTITLTIGDREYTLTVGSLNPGASDYYIQLEGVRDVYLVPSYNLSPVIELLSSPPYIQPTPDPNVTPSATPEGLTG
jgi:hypothetical protein